MSRFAKWLYEWMTVIGAILIGFATIVLPYLDMLGALDWSSVLPASAAVKVVFAIAVIKWTCVVLGAIAARRREGRECLPRD